MARKKTGGRQKGTSNKATQQVRDILDNEVDFSNVVKKLLELVNGVEIAKQTDSGTKVYTEKPDAYAARILLEYRFGKPQQAVDHSGEIQKVVRIVRD